MNENKKYEESLKNIDLLNKKIEDLNNQILKDKDEFKTTLTSEFNQYCDNLEVVYKKNDSKLD